MELYEIMFVKFWKLYSTIEFKESLIQICKNLKDKTSNWKIQESSVTIIKIKEQTNTYISKKGISFR